MTKIQVKIINDYFYKWYEIPQVIYIAKIGYMCLLSLEDDTDTYSVIKQIEDTLCLNRLEDVKVFKERNEEDVKEKYETNYIA